jgi:rubrerythrin
MVSRPMSRGNPSRRELLVSGALLAGGGSAIALAACGGSSRSESTSTVSTIQTQSDAIILNALLDQEHSSIAAYGTLAPHLSAARQAAARRFLAHERAHASALAQEVKRLGEAPAAAKPDSVYRAGFPTLRNAADALSFAIDVETTAVSAYADAVGKLATLPLRDLVASILATESQHMSVALGELGRPQVPQAFVTGPVPGKDVS